MKLLLKNFSYNVAYQILAIIFPLFTTPYISRVIGAEGIGIYSYTNAIAYNFILFAMLGMSNLGNRSIASVNNNKDRRSTVFWNLYTVQAIAFIITVIIYIYYVNVINQSYQLYLNIQLIYLISGLLDISWLYFGMEEFKVTVLRNLLIKLISIICIFIFVRNKTDLSIYCLIMSLSYLLSQIYLWLPLKNHVNIKKPSIKIIQPYLKPLIILFIPVIAYSIYKVMDKIMLGMFSTMSQVGYYENSLKIINIPMGIITALGTVMLPRMTSIFADNENNKALIYIKTSMHLVSIISSAICFGIIAISDHLSIIYFGKDYAACGNLMKILALTCFFVGWANVGRTQYLIPKKLDSIYLISTIGGALINLSINLMLIPLLAAAGAAIGTVFAELSVMVIQFFLLRKYINLFKYLKQTAPYIIIGLFMCLVVSMFEQLLKYGWISLFIEVLIGFIIYSGLLFLYMKRTENFLYLIIKNHFNYKQLT